MPRLSDPIVIRGMEVKNRLAFPPMLTFSHDKYGRPTDRTYNAYEQKARGGAGMIVYENVTIIPDYIGGGGANIGSDDDVPAYKKMADLLHKHDVKIGMQIGDGGLIGFVLGTVFNVDVEPLGPSKIDLLKATSAYEVMIPAWADMLKNRGAEIRELKREELIELENQFAAGAKRAIQAGFDFIELHSGHGMLHAAFLSPYANKRTDEYGGSLENKCRFHAETIEKIRNSIGEKPPILVRFSADELLPDGNRIEDSKKIAQILENAGADCIDVSQGIMIRNPTGIQIPTYFDHGCFIHLAEEIKKVVNVPVIGVGRIIDPKMADEFIQQGKADIIYMGRQLICDPQTPNKYFNRQLDDIKYCIGCLQGCNAICVYDAFSGQNYKELTPSTDPKKIVILGAGIAGMEAARVAKLRGHEVEIYEKTDKIGGIMPLVAAEYKKEDFMNIINYLETQLKKLEVPIYLNKDLTKEEITALKPDILVLAAGSEATIPVNLKDKVNILTQDEAILKSKPMGKNVVVWGLNTFWKGGVETAITLSEQGYNVKALVGPEGGIAELITLATGRRFWIICYLQRKNIPVYTKAKLLDVTENSVKFLDIDKNEQSIEADNLIYCGSRIANNKNLQKKFEGVAPKIISIGDGKRPRDIQQAMKDAQTFARKLK
ncbi:MAG: FAD-dependent oxidoreductase [Candidatus Hodarchaeota archaeon]